MEVTSQFSVHIGFVVVRSTVRVEHRNSGDHYFPSGLAWEVFRKLTPIAPLVASEASKVLMVTSWTSVREAIRSTRGASPPRLGGRTGRDKYGPWVAKGQTKSDQGREVLV